MNRAQLNQPVAKSASRAGGHLDARPLQHMRRHRVSAEKHLNRSGRRFGPQFRGNGAQSGGARRKLFGHLQSRLNTSQYCGL